MVIADMICSLSRTKHDATDSVQFIGHRIVQRWFQPSWISPETWRRVFTCDCLFVHVCVRACSMFARPIWHVADGESVDYVCRWRMRATRSACGKPGLGSWMGCFRAANLDEHASCTSKHMCVYLIVTMAIGSRYRSQFVSSTRVQAFGKLASPISLPELVFPLAALK